MNEPLTEREMQQPTRNRRQRRTFLIVQIVLAVLLLCVLGFGGRWAALRFYTENPSLRLTEIVVEDLRGEDAPQNRTEHFTLAHVRKILKECGCEEGKSNLLKLDLLAMRTRLEKESLLERVEIRRELPRTLRVSLLERTPVAFLVKGSKTYACVDRNLVLFPPLCSRKLPNIYFVPELEKMQFGVPQEDSLGLRAAVELIYLVGQRDFTPENGYSLANICISVAKNRLNCNLKPFANNHVLVVRDNQYPQVLFPIEPEKLAGALNRFDEIVQQRMLERGIIRYADVTLEINPFAREDLPPAEGTKSSAK